MTVLRRTMPMEVTHLGDREVEIRMMTGGLKDDGYDLIPTGVLLDRYVTNPIQLWQHNPECPVGSNDNVRVEGDSIAARCTFAPVGVSAKADEVCGLVKCGVVRACSIGFEILERAPIDPKDLRAGYRAIRWILLECSFVSVPLDAKAGVTARAQLEGPDMDNGAAEGGSAIEVPKPKRSHRRRAIVAKPKIRGMYGVAQLAFIVDMLADTKFSAEIETQLEGDDSKVPAMLAACLQQLGAALVAMTAEEVSELVGGDDDDVDVVSLADDEVDVVRAAKTPALQRFVAAKFRTRAVLTATRAGKALSAANAEKIGEAEGHHTRAMEHQAAAVECRDNLGDNLDGMQSSHDKARAAHDAMGAELENDKPDPQALRKHHQTMGRNMDAVSANLSGATDEQDAMGDAHRGIGRSVRAATRCLRMVDGYDPEEEGDGVAGDDPVEGDDRDLRQRELDMIRLRAA